jgi:hypothetical protein
MRFFIQTNINVWIHKSVLENTIIWKITRIVLEDLCQNPILCVFENIKWNERKFSPKIIQNVHKRKYICLLEMYCCSVFLPMFPILESCAFSMVNPNLNLGVQFGTFSNQGLLNLSWLTLNLKGCWTCCSLTCPLNHNFHNINPNG